MLWALSLGKRFGNILTELCSVSCSKSVLLAFLLCRFHESDKFPEEFPYRAKAVFAFEEIDGKDVCFFGMHVQEYGSDCPSPNTRWA